MLKNIIFDMDGVLLDSEECIRTACIHMFKNYGVNAKHEDFIPFTGMGETKFIGGVAEKYNLEFNPPKMKAEAYAIYEQLAEQFVVIFPGIKELTIELRKRGYKIAVASSADEVKVLINLKCIGLTRNDFDAVVTGTDVSKNKPDPEIFLAAATKIGADPQETLVVEDAISGCMAAKAAGMRCVGVKSTFAAEKLLDVGALQVLEKTVDLLDILDKI